jgi:hypothetical protein
LQAPLPIHGYMMEIKEIVDGSNFGCELGSSTHKAHKVFLFSSFVESIGNGEKWSKKRVE